MQIKEHAPLAPYTTFFIGGPSRYLIFAQTDEEVLEAVQFAKDRDLPLLVFGGGSNMLVADNGWYGVAVRVETVGMDIVSQTDNEIFLKIASGEVWDDVVRLACEEGWWGIENLSHIPGFAGALAVQNVGAYGQEASDVVHSVTALDLQTSKIVSLSKDQLAFSYRTSIFNSTEKDRYIILNTTLHLKKQGQPNLSYGDLNERFQGSNPSIDKIRKAVIEIRNQKFPFPSEPVKGNAGSFFRGPLLSAEQFNNLTEKVSSKFGQDAAERLQRMQSRLQVAQGYKTPTAFLIELCVGKDLGVGGAKLNPNQPAIILNYTGQASANDVFSLFRTVSDQVFEQTGVRLGAEPQFIGFEDQV